MLNMDISQAFQSYNETMRLGFEQLNRDLRALNDAADNLVMRLAAEDGAIVPDTREVTE